METQAGRDGGEEIGEVYLKGYESGLRGEDPRICPYEKMTLEYRTWHQGQCMGVALARLITAEPQTLEPDHNPSQSPEPQPE